MTTIKIHRSKEFKSSLRQIEIENHGRILGSIKNGETKEFKVTVDSLYLKATLDACASNPIEMGIKEDEMLEFNLSHNSGSAFINMFAKKNQFFKLEQVKK